MLRALVLGLSLVACSGAYAQSFEYSLPSPTVPFNPTDGSGTAIVDVTVTELASASFPNATQALSLGVAHQTTTLDLISVDSVGALSAVRAGMGPEFFGTSFYANGATVGCVYTFDLSEEITFSSATPVVELTYTGDVDALQGVFTDVTGSVSFVQTLGDPDVRNAVLSDFVEYVPSFVPGTITFTPVLPDFVRADVNGDGEINLVDVARCLSVLFQGDTVECTDAVDIDDNGILEITDAVSLLSYLFLSGGPPAAPFPDCGADPTPGDPVPCDSYSGCP